MNLRFIDWIWHITGSLALAPGQSGEDAFDLLDPLFREPGTSHDRTTDTLSFRKRDQAAQDKMSIFDGGVLRIEQGEAGNVLRYRLASRALLFCFLAPFMFLGVAQLTIVVAAHQKAAAEAAAKAGKADAKKKAEKKDVVLPQNPIDKALGAPAPEKPKKDGKDKDKGKKDKGPSPVPAYVFAGIFATLYLVGRLLEDWLIRRLFRKRLFGQGEDHAPALAV